MLLLYKGLVPSRLLPLPLLSLAWPSGKRWKRFTGFHRSRFAGNLGVILEAQAFRLRLQSEARALEHVRRFSCSQSSFGLLGDLLSRPHSQPASFVQNFRTDIGAPSYQRSRLPSSLRQPLNVHLSIPNLDTKTTTPTTVRLLYRLRVDCTFTQEK